MIRDSPCTSQDRQISYILLTILCEILTLSGNLCIALLCVPGKTPTETNGQGKHYHDIQLNVYMHKVVPCLRCIGKYPSGPTLAHRYIHLVIIIIKSNEIMLYKGLYLYVYCVTRYNPECLHA